MEDFSVTKTAFAGYRLLAARPMTAVWWFALAVILTLIQGVAVVEMAGPQLAALQDMRAAGQMDPASMGAVSRGLAPYYLFSFLFPWLAGVVTVGAATRAVLKPEDSGFGYLRFGGDEMRLLVTTLVLAVIFVVVAFAAALVGGIFLATVGGRSVLMGIRANGNQITGQALAYLLGGASPILLVLLFLAVKLSLAPAQTVAEKSIQVFGSWTLTNGRFWKTLATYILALIPVVIITCIAYAIMASGGAGGDVAARLNAMSTGMDTFAHAFDGKHIIAYLIQAVARVLAMAAVLMPAAMIYKTAAPKDVDAFDDDDDDDDD